MRTRWRSAPLLISAAAHVGLIAWLASRKSPAPAPEPAPTTIELIELPAEADRPQAAIDPAPTGKIAPASKIAPTSKIARRRATRTIRRPDPTPAPPSTGMLRMRTHTRGRDPEAPPRSGPGIPSPRDIARIVVADPGPAKPPGPLAPLRPRKPPRPRSELRPSGGGTYRVDDGPFVAKIGEDGRVTLTDKPNFHFRLSRLGGGFDLTDWAMRASGQDPYSSRKLAFMDRTRAERASIATKHQSEALRNAVAKLKGHLGRIWAYRKWSPARRRRILFELWDDCAEKGSAQVLDASAEARATIIGFIRRELPAGSAHAYTRAELARLNARRTSKPRFAPY